MKADNTTHEDMILKLAREIFPESLTDPIEGQRAVLDFGHRLLKEVTKREGPAAWLVKNSGRNVSAYAWKQPFIGEGWENTPLYDLTAFTAANGPTALPRAAPAAGTPNIRLIPAERSRPALLRAGLVNANE